MMNVSIFRVNSSNYILNLQAKDLLYILLFFDERKIAYGLFATRNFIIYIQ